MNIGIGDPWFPRPALQESASKLFAEIVTQSVKSEDLSSISCIDVAIWNVLNDSKSQKRHRFFERYRRVKIEMPLNYENLLSMPNELAIRALALISVRELLYAFDKFGRESSCLATALRELECNAPVVAAASLIVSTRSASPSSEPCEEPALIQFVLTPQNGICADQRFEEVLKKAQVMLESAADATFDGIDRYDHLGFATAVSRIDDPRKVLKVSMRIGRKLSKMFSDVDIRVEDADDEVLWQSRDDGLRVLGGKRSSP